MWAYTLFLSQTTLDTPKLNGEGSLCGGGGGAYTLAHTHMGMGMRMWIWNRQMGLGGTRIVCVVHVEHAWSDTKFVLERSHAFRKEENVEKVWPKLK